MVTEQVGIWGVVVLIFQITAGLLTAWFVLRQHQAQAKAAIHKAEEEGATGRAAIQPDLIKVLAGLPAEFANSATALLRIISDQQGQIELLQNGQENMRDRMAMLERQNNHLQRLNEELTAKLEQAEAHVRSLELLLEEHRLIINDWIAGYEILENQLKALGQKPKWRPAGRMPRQHDGGSER